MYGGPRLAPLDQDAGSASGRSAGPDRIGQYISLTASTGAAHRRLQLERKLEMSRFNSKGRMEAEINVLRQELQTSEELLAQSQK
jgi:hypothetical protein